MFIIIEGTDAAGKSTLIEAVHAETRRRHPDRKIHLLHKGRPAEETRRWVVSDYVLSVEDVDLDRDIIIADRWHWGEATYAPLKRPHTDTDGFGLLGRAGWRWTELFLASRGVAHFWLYQPLDVISRRLAERGDDYVRVEELGGILRLHRRAYKNSLFSIKLSPVDGDLDAVKSSARAIVDFAEACAAVAAPLRQFPHYIGDVEPRVLLVGDERPARPWYGSSTTLPFIPVDGNSGNYLMSALRERFWRRVGVVNANERPDQLAELWVALGRPAVVALGRAAEKALVRAGFDADDYAVLPHPQFVRRFFNRRKSSYGRAIARMSKNVRRDDKWTLQ